MVQLTQNQRTNDWFLARMFCFTINIFHILVDVSATIYFNADELKVMHKECLDIDCLAPHKLVQSDNALLIEDEDVYGQRGNLGSLH